MAKKETLFAWGVCGLGALFYCYEYFLRVTPSVMMQELMTSFNITAAAVSNLAAFYYYAYTPMQLPVGVLMDRYGPRLLLTLACLACVLGTYFFASSHLGVAQTGRFLVGFGSAFAFVGVLKLATLWLPPHRFAMVAGITTSLGMLGGCFGDAVLAPIVAKTGWHEAIYYSVIVGAILAVFLWMFIPGSNRKPPHHDHPAMSYNQLLREMVVLIRNPQMWLVGLVGALLYLPLSAFAELWGVAYLQRTYNLSSSKAALFNLTIFLGWAVGGPLLGWISDHLKNRRRPIIVCALIATLVITLILYMPAFFQGHLGFLAFALFVFGVFTSVQVVVFAIARELNISGLAGTALAVTNMLVMIGGTLSQPLIGRFLQFISQKTEHNTQFVGLSHFSAHDFQYALVILPIGILLAAGVMFFIKETHAKPRAVIPTMDNAS